MTDVLVLDNRTRWMRPHFVASLFSPARPDPIEAPEPQVSPPTTIGQPTWLFPVLESMSELLRLGDNWDARGSVAVRSDALSFAFAMLARVMPPSAPAPAIVPLGHGGVQLIWHGANGELEVEVVRPNEVVIYHLERTGVEREWPATMDFSDLQSILWSDFRE
jgi:hypothetical protein